MRRLAPCLVGLVSALVFINAAPDVTVHDDRYFAPTRYGLDDASLARMFSQDAWSATGAPAGVYRPLFLLTLAIDGARSGSGLRGYHVTNILLHATAAMALYALLLALLRRGSAPGVERSRPSRLHVVAAAGAALVWGVHPIHAEAVDSIYNRSEILVTLGTVSALWVIQRWEERRPARAWTLAGLIYLAALLCRESAVSLPALAALMLGFLHPEDGWRRLARRLAPLASLIVPLALYLALRQSALSGALSGTPTLAENVDPRAGFGYQLALVLASLREYLRMVFWPHPLRASYEDLGVTAVPVSLAVLALMLGLAIGLRRRAPVLTLGIGFFYLALLPSTRLATASSLQVSLGGHVLFHPASGLVLVAERVVYMPSVGFALALAGGLAALGRRVGIPAAGAAALALCALLAPMTYLRSEDWHSETALWEAETRAAPRNGDAWRLLVAAYQSEGRSDRVARICDAQRDRHPRIAQLQNNCGIGYAALRRFADAEASYRRAIDLGLAAVGHANLGRLLAEQGRASEAETEFVEAARAETNPARRHLRQAQVLLRFHPDRIDEARAELEQALALQPGFRPAQDLLRQIPSRSGGS
jgi:tetratricopeptide (TPR) repeat protein